MKKLDRNNTYVITGVGRVYADRLPDAGVSFRIGRLHIQVWPKLSLRKVTSDGYVILF